MKFPLNKYKTILIIAILSGVTRVIIDYIFRFFDSSPLIYYSTFLICFILEVFLIFQISKKYKEINSEFTLIDSLKIGISIMGVIGLAYCSMAYIYDIYIDPNFQYNTTIKFNEVYAPDQLELVKENLKTQNNTNSFIGIFIYTIWFVFLGAVISLISGSILRTSQN